MKICSIEGCNEKHEARGLCSKHYSAKWRKEHPENWHIYYTKNAEKIRQIARARGNTYYISHLSKKLEYQKKYRRNNKESINKHFSDRRKTDINFRLACALRSRLSIALKRNLKTGSAIRDLGCSIDFFRKHLESLWGSGMSWDNYGHGDNRWNIDHIKSLSKTNLTERKEFLGVCHYTNLQPMWHIDNVRKSNK
jgi:hypothetical protein